jgi:hypothetical protein
MHVHAHFGLGWAAGTAAPGSDRLLRGCCVAAAAISDVDAAAYLLGEDAYEELHHTFGHNLLLGVVVVAVCTWLHRHRSWRRRLLVVVLTSTCFGAHLLTDAWFTRYPVHPWWPFSHRQLLFESGVYLDHPLNWFLIAAAMLAIVPLAMWRKVTPLELISPRLDRLVVDAFRTRELSCTTCGRPCGHRCDECGSAVCLRHGRVGWRFRIACPDCVGQE